MKRSAFTVRGLAMVTAGALLAVACGGKVEPGDEFSSFAGLDEKSDSFSRQMRVVGMLTYGQTSAPVAYVSPPRYRAFKFSGKRGDKIKVRVSSTNGDPVTWVTDNEFRVIGYNDDASRSTTNSYIALALPGNRVPTVTSYYIIFRDYYAQRATFSVKLEGPPQDFFSCARDTDCEKTHDTCCAISSWIAVKTGTADAYHRSLGCAQNPICPRIATRPDNTVPICNAETRKCSLIKPEEILCSAFRVPNLRSCPTGYVCATLPENGDPRADAPGYCYQNCGGFGGFECTFPSYECIDRPYDDCDPNAGGADCPGICAPGPRPTDCRTRGCERGKNCQNCWGSFACVPDGAVC